MKKILKTRNKKSQDYIEYLRTRIQNVNLKIQNNKNDHYVRNAKTIDDMFKIHNILIAEKERYLTIISDVIEMESLNGTLYEYEVK